jgi:hypothetical protein
MSREYTISAAGITVVGATTLVALRPPTNCAIEILRMWINQSANPTSAQQRIEWGRQVAAFQTLTAATPNKHKEGDPISQIVGGTGLAVGTCGVNASAEGAGVKTPIGHDAFNVVSGHLWLPGPDETIILSPSGTSAFYLYFPVAPATLTDWSFGLTFKEIG